MGKSRRNNNRGRGNNNIPIPHQLSELGIDPNQLYNIEDDLNKVNDKLRQIKEYLDIHDGMIYNTTAPNFNEQIDIYQRLIHTKEYLEQLLTSYTNINQNITEFEDDEPIPQDLRNYRQYMANTEQTIQDDLNYLQRYYPNTLAQMDLGAEYITDYPRSPNLYTEPP